MNYLNSFNNKEYSRLAFLLQKLFDYMDEQRKLRDMMITKERMSMDDPSNNKSCIEDYKNGKRLYYLKIDVNIMMNIRKQPYLVFREDYGATSKNEI